MASFLVSVAGFIMRAVLWLGAAVFALSLLLAGLLALVAGGIWMLLTGRRPVLAFRSYHDFSRRTGWPQHSPWQRSRPVPGAGNSSASAAEVIDAEVKEVPDKMSR